ncbi:hypothetical protein [Labilibaculum sp.]|uniref:hypothetical protein n=1 Tax=Labilibaculum sp. TaxID=2060723 RepID=UPI002AA72877|nr:hypothetical protein [Labilibaculum sp.]
MKIKGKLLEKLVDAGINIEEVERETDFNEEGEKVKYQIAKFPRARDFVPIKFNDRIEEQILLDSNFEHYKFIMDFEAIWSPKFKSIECEIAPVTRHMAPPSFLLKRLGKLLCDDDSEPEEFARYELEKSENGIVVSIGSASVEYAILSFCKDRMPRFDFARRRPTIRIENIDITKHDKAKSLLEKIGNSVLFKLDLSSNIGFKLVDDREIRRTYFRRKREQTDLDKAFPTYEYDSEPMSLYWYAKSAIEMPLLQFLALYQILEFYFPIFSNKNAHSTIKNIIKDPRFNPNKDSDITKILSTLNLNKNQLGFGSELEQLKSTIQDCLSIEELRDHIERDEEMVEFFKGKKAKDIASKTLNIANKTADLINEIAERIYEIRCRVVHTKSSDKNYDLLIPSSPELKYLVYDISVLEMIAKKVLIATSRLMKI